MEAIDLTVEPDDVSTMSERRKRRKATQAAKAAAATGFLGDIAPAPVSQVPMASSAAAVVDLTLRDSYKKIRYGSYPFYPG